MIHSSVVGIMTSHWKFPSCKRHQRYFNNTSCRCDIINAKNTDGKSWRLIKYKKYSCIEYWFLITGENANSSLKRPRSSHEAHERAEVGRTTSQLGNFSNFTWPHQKTNVWTEITPCSAEVSLQGAAAADQTVLCLHKRVLSWLKIWIN